MKENLIDYMRKKNIPPAVIEMSFKIKWEDINEIDGWYILDKLLMCEGTKTAEYERECLRTGTPIVR